MTQSAWDPRQYERFKAERRRPFDDLVSLVESRGQMRVVDLGCGSGELTRDLHDRLDARATLGVDSSDTMLAESAAFAGAGVTFVHADISDLRRALSDLPPARAGAARAIEFDLVFSNAALQWVDDHDRLFTEVASLVAPGGQLAVQMPTNFDHPSHVIAHDLAGTEPYRSELRGWNRAWPVMPAEWYEHKLFELGFTRRHVRMQIYGHELPDREAVVDWVKGTMLTTYRERLAPEVYEWFLADYRTRLLDTFADERPFLYTYKRLLIWGA